MHSPLRLGWLAANRCPGTGTATRLATTNRLFRSDCSDSSRSDQVLQSLRVRVTFRGVTFRDQLDPDLTLYPEVTDITDLAAACILHVEYVSTQIVHTTKHT